MKVGDIMESSIRYCAVDSSLETAANIMWENAVEAVPVLNNDGTPRGLITDRDIAIAAALNHKPLWELNCGEVLGERPLYTCRVDDDILSAVKTLWAQRLKRLPVVDDSGQLRGLLAVDDIVAFAERGTRGQGRPEISYDDAVNAMKAVARTH